MPVKKLGLLFSILTLLAVSCLGQKPDEETIKVKTALVSVPVIVSDRDGRYIPNLKQGDFVVQQDGIEQKIEFFATSEEPINVAFLIDTSQSTREVLDDIKKAANNMIKLLQPADKGLVVSFDYDTHVLSPLTGDKNQLKDAIKSADIPRDVGTTMRDAVLQTVRKQFAGINGRKAIILLTDGKDHGSRITETSLLYALQESDVMIYSVFFDTVPGGSLRQIFARGPGGLGRGGRFPPPPPPPPQRKQNQKRTDRNERMNEMAAGFLRQMSDTTAGRFYESEASTFKETFTLILDELRHQYRLGFYPAEESGGATTHSLKVKVQKANSVVRARSTYRLDEK